MRKSSTHVGAAVLALPSIEARRLVHEKDSSSKLDPVGQCPYCHHDLMKKELRLPSVIRRLVQSFARNWDVLLTYWVCMNEECCLMFWRHPRASRWVPPIVDDMMEH